MKKILLFLVALFVTTMVFAYSEVDGITYYFDHENKTATVTFRGDNYGSIVIGNDYSGDIVIPEKVRYNGVEYSVTSIGRYAFYDCTGLTSIEIPNSVTSIGSSAFSRCTGLTLIEIPNSVTEIGDYAFSGCTGLTSIEIPNSVTSIGSSAFSGCTGLTSIEVDNDNQNYASVDGVLYNKNITTVICCSKGKTSIEIPNSVTEIGNDAFEGCTGLTTVTIGNSVTSIGEYAFEGCTGLTSIEIPNSVTSIGDYAFRGCTGLTSITIGENVTKIGSNSIRGCVNLNNVVWNAIKYSGENTSIFGSSVTSITIGENVTSIESKVFEDCSNLTTVVWNAIKYDNSASGLFKGQITSFIFGNKVEHIPYSLCSGMKELTSIIIPESVTSIGGSVFSGCTGLTSIEVDNDNQNYASVDGVLYNKNITTVICCPKGKTSIEIPNSVTEIGEYAFRGCTGLTSIEIPNSVTEIGWDAFNGCTGLTSITIGENVTEIGSNSFEDCDNLNTVVWNAIKYSGENTSIFGSSVTSITIGENVTSIERKVFEDCSNLTTVVWNAIKYYKSASGLFKGQITSFTFGNNVEHIPNYLCFGMNGLSSITIPNSVTSIGSSVFSGCKGLTSIEIPNSVTEIGDAFEDCTGLTSIIIGNGVTEIDETIFYNCTGLTSIVIGKGITSIDKDAFKDCSSLALVKWNAKRCNDFSSGENPFATKPITSFTFGDDVERIPAYLCYNKTDLSSIVIPNLVTEIGESAFEGCGKLRTVEIGKSITSIEGKAFAGCTAIYSMGVDAIIPPIVEASTFENVSRTTQIKVPCSAVAAYQASSYWNEFTNYIETPNTLSVEVNDNTMGMAVVTKQNTCTDITATVQAQARPGYEFVKWSDGFTENPHTVFVMEDMTITAEFAPVAKEYNVSVVCDATMGSVNGSGTYKEGESVTIEAVANQGYYFVKWSDGNTENPRTIVVAEDVILTAEFELDVTISVENTEDSSAIIYVRNGMIYVEGIETYYHVLDVAGRLVYIGRDAMLSLPRGVYVVVVGDEVQKVVL